MKEEDKESANGKETRRIVTKRERQTRTVGRCWSENNAVEAPTSIYRNADGQRIARQRTMLYSTRVLENLASMYSCSETYQRPCRCCVSPGIAGQQPCSRFVSTLPMPPAIGHLQKCFISFCHHFFHTGTSEIAVRKHDPLVACSRRQLDMANCGCKQKAGWRRLRR